MSSPDQTVGPQVTQCVAYNNNGTITAAIIYAVNTDGTVNLVYFGPSGATSVTNVCFDPNKGVGKWSYPQFQ